MKFSVTRRIIHFLRESSSEISDFVLSWWFIPFLGSYALKEYLRSAHAFLTHKIVFRRTRGVKVEQGSERSFQVQFPAFFNNAQFTTDSSFSLTHKVRISKNPEATKKNQESCEFKSRNRTHLNQRTFT